tara:strand:- start:89 stop:1237 length:1149 start_codon:yes stop_codon:yes gene_type:complete
MQLETNAAAPASLFTVPRGRLFCMVTRGSADMAKAAGQLIARGYAVVDVCSPERAAELESEVWTDLEALGTGIDRNDPKTWTNDRWPQTSHGLLQNQQVGLWEGTCLARLETEETWWQLLGQERVISSFDAIAVCRPDSQERCYKAELRNQKEKGEGELLSSWLHTDQAKAKTQCLHHIQGAFAITDLGPAEQRTQLVVPKSPLETMQSFRDRFVAAFPPEPVAKGKFNPEREEWVKHSDAERAWLLREGEIVTPELKAGQMLLWDSGVPHASIPGPVAEGQKRKVRISTFVSAVPIAGVSPHDLRERKKMLEQGDTSGHRVTAEGKTKYLQCKFAKVGRSYGKKLPTYSAARVVSGFKRAHEEDDDSVAAKTARFCGGYGF